MTPISSTPEILGFKALGREVDQVWIDWAYGMLLAGFDTEHLRILAGEHEPFEQFELQHLADKVFMELGFDLTDPRGLIEGYIRHLADQALRGEAAPLNVLALLKDLYLEIGNEPLLQRSYLLFHAQQDLMDMGISFHLDDVDRANVDARIMEHFRALRNGTH